MILAVSSSACVSNRPLPQTEGTGLFLEAEFEPAWAAVRECLLPTPLLWDDPRVGLLETQWIEEPGRAGERRRFRVEVARVEADPEHEQPAGVRVTASCRVERLESGAWVPVGGGAPRESEFLQKVQARVLR